MEVTRIVIAGLMLLDIGVVILARWFDRKYYSPFAPVPEQSVPNNFFANKSFDEPINRFLLSNGGALLLSLIFISIVILTIKIPDGKF